MHVLIIEDLERDYTNLKNALQEVSDRMQIPMKVYWRRDLKELSAILPGMDLVFLDVELEQSNGIDYFRQHPQTDRSYGLVILSQHTKYLAERYKIQADRFLIKPLKPTIFFMEMEEYLPMLLKRQGGFYDERLSACKIRFQDLIWIDSHDHKTTLHFVRDITKEESVPIAYWQNKLDPALFVSPYRGILVNLCHVATTTPLTWTLDDGTRIPVSRYKRKTMEDAYFQFQVRQV